MPLLERRTTADIALFTDGIPRANGQVYLPTITYEVGFIGFATHRASPICRAHFVVYADDSEHPWWMHLLLTSGSRDRGTWKVPTISGSDRRHSLRLGTNDWNININHAVIDWRLSWQTNQVTELVFDVVGLVDKQRKIPRWTLSEPHYATSTTSRLGSFLVHRLNWQLNSHVEIPPLIGRPILVDVRPEINAECSREGEADCWYSAQYCGTPMPLSVRIGKQLQIASMVAVEKVHFSESTVGVFLSGLGEAEIGTARGD